MELSSWSIWDLNVTFGLRCCWRLWRLHAQAYAFFCVLWHFVLLFVHVFVRAWGGLAWAVIAGGAHGCLRCFR